MVLARYSFGYASLARRPSLMVELLLSYILVALPVLFNLVGMMGFNIVDCILGGQTLASIANGNMSWTYVHLITVTSAPFQDFPGLGSLLLQSSLWLSLSWDTQSFIGN